MTDQHAPSDETQPHPAGAPDAADAAGQPRPTGAASGDEADSAVSRGTTPGDGLRADPDRSAPSAWREPPWFPPRERDRERRSSPIAIVVGLGLIGLGLYFFVERTLGVALPRIQWSTVWPVVLIVIGGLILLRSVGRRS